MRADRFRRFADRSRPYTGIVSVYRRVLVAALARIWWEGKRVGVEEGYKGEIGGCCCVYSVELLRVDGRGSFSDDCPRT